MRPLVCFNPPIRRCTPCSKHFFLVPVLFNVIALAPWPLSALRTLNSLLRKVRHVPPCRYGPTTVCMSPESWHTGHRTTVSPQPSSRLWRRPGLRRAWPTDGPRRRRTHTSCFGWPLLRDAITAFELGFTPV